ITPPAPSAIAALSPTLESSRLAPYASCEGHTYIGRAELSQGSVVFLPTPKLLTNASLVARDNARLLLPLIPSERGRIEIVDGWTGNAADSPLGTLRAAGLLPWLAQIALLGLAFALYRGTPFGQRHELPGDPRQSFRAHVLSLRKRWA